MDGLYLNKNKALKSIYTWLYPIFNGENWEGNNLHIDEITTLKKIERDEWVCLSFLMLEAILEEVKVKNPYLIFLHIVLSDADYYKIDNKISFEWIKNNLNEYTTPSFNCTTRDYFEQFYKHELQECYFNKSPSTEIEFKKMRIFYRSHFDSLEKMYLREIYIFDNCI